MNAQATSCPLCDKPRCACSELSKAEYIGRRKEKAIELYQQGWTQQQIARKFGLSQGWISTLLQSNNVKGTGKDTLGRKKSPGRPKGRKPKPRQTDQVKEDIIAQADNGKSSNDIAVDAGVGGRAVRHLLGEERIRQEAFEKLLGTAAAKNFSEKGALRIEDAIRIHKARLDRAFEARVNEEVRRRIAEADDATRKHNTELRHENLRLSQMLNQRGVFTESQYNKLMMCVHPDNPASEPVRREIQALLNDKNNQRRLITTNGAAK